MSGTNSVVRVSKSTEAEHAQRSRIGAAHEAERNH